MQTCLNKPLKIGFRIAAWAWLLLAMICRTQAYATEHTGGRLHNRGVNVPFQATDTRYVTTEGSHIFPYDSWDTAATNIQAAIDAAPSGGQVLVSNGVYTVSTPILLTNAVTVRGVDGPETTHVSGANATRVFVLGHRNAVIEGLTIRDGRIEGDDLEQDSGGGIWFDPEGSGGTLWNCIVRDNYTEQDGGGVYMSGKPEGTWMIRNCLIVGNQAQEFGGGLFVGNYGVVQNCTVVHNDAWWGGGINVWEATAVTIENNIFYYNTDDDGDPDHVLDDSLADYNAAPGLTDGHNIEDAPTFANNVTGNYRLDGSQTNWPGLHGGVVRSWMLHAVDLDGHDRLDVVDGQLFVDMGAYQRVSVNATTAKGTPIAWFQSHNIAIDPDRDEANWNDVDARYNSDKWMTLRQEYLADTDPNDPTSLFRIIALERAPHELTLTVSVSSDRLYTLEYATEPAFTNWAPLPGYHDLQELPDPLTITNPFGARSSKFYRIRVRDLEN